MGGWEMNKQPPITVAHPEERQKNQFDKLYLVVDLIKKSISPGHF